MSLPRLDHATRIADQLNNLAAVVKTRSRASLTDANRILETISARFLNALFGWELVNLNTERANYPAADLGDRGRRIAIQVTNEDGSDKINHTATKAVEHKLGTDFDRLIVFFLLSKKPSFPKNFAQPPNGPKIETWDIADLLKQLPEISDLNTLVKAAGVLDEEMGNIREPSQAPQFDISRILKYAPAELIGREDDLKLLHAAWSGDITSPITIHGSPFTFRSRPRVLTFVALCGEGKTSLVAKWAAELAAQDWPGCDAAFAWSFYSQGTREEHTGSADLFLKEALNFFAEGHAEEKEIKKFAASNAGPFEKGQRLARLVGQRRNLLILDGLEPLQYAPTAPMPGELKDEGIAALLKGLAAASHGLCIVTTRYSLPDLRAFWQTTAPEVKLLRLSRDAGVHLLKTLGVRKEGGSPNEFAQLVEDVKGHALTLTLLGGYLKLAHHGDIRRVDRVDFQKADETVTGGHAFRTLSAYERWFEENNWHADLAIMQMLGLFDRPAPPDCLAALQHPPIPGLTDAVASLGEEEWNEAVTHLVELNMVQEQPWKACSILGYGEKEAKEVMMFVRMNVNHELGKPKPFGVPGSSFFNWFALDTHPLIREFFSNRLQTSLVNAWTAANSRLFDYLRASVPYWPEGLDGLVPLYQAITHGCHAGRFQEALTEVFVERINRGTSGRHPNPHASYSTTKLGALGADLGAAERFFDKRWSQVSDTLSGKQQTWLLSHTASNLKAVGRLTEAMEIMRVALSAEIKRQDFNNAARSAGNLSELELTLGLIDEAMSRAAHSVGLAHHCPVDVGFVRIGNRGYFARALHQAGRSNASAEFEAAEALQAEGSPVNPILNGVFGFYYCELLLSDSERGAWRKVVHQRCQEVRGDVQPIQEVERRTVQTLQWANQGGWLLNIGLDNLTLGRIALYKEILIPETPKAKIASYVSGKQGAKPGGLQSISPATFLVFLATATWARIVSSRFSYRPDRFWRQIWKGT